MTLTDEAKAAPQVGDLVTPENVASLPVGAIVRWTDVWPGVAVRRDADLWNGTGGNMSDADVSEPSVPAYIAYLPGVESADGREVTRG